MSDGRLLRVGVIGKSNHAARLIDILDGSDRVDEIQIYYHRPYDGDDPRVSGSFDAMLDCDAVVIASPTPTHMDYLQRLSDFNGHVLVEKPVVSTPSESGLVAALPEERRQKIAVNYNFAQSPIARSIAEILRRKQLGKAIHLSIRAGHGLAFTPKYRQNWRSSADNYGVAELVGVHYIHFASHLFGAMAGSEVQLLNCSGQGGGTDTAFITLTMACGTRVDILVSYAMPFDYDIGLIGTDGIYRFDGRRETVSAPRESFDAAGRFAAPPVVHSRDIAHPDNWRQGLVNSVEDFLQVAADGGTFSDQALNMALSAMQPLFTAGLPDTGGG